MGMNKPGDYMLSEANGERELFKPSAEPLPLDLVQRMELEILLEELAEIIESEEGILIP